MEGTIEIGLVSAAVLEFIKWLLRRPFLLGEGFDFPPGLYAALIAALNVALIPAMAFFGFPGFVMPTDWQAWGLFVLRTLIGSLVSLGAYTVGLKPLKSYAKSYAESKRDDIPHAWGP